MRVHLAIVASRLDLLPEVLPRIRPYFDRAVVLVDGTAPTWMAGKLVSLAKRHDCDWAMHGWRHENARCMNMAFAAIGDGWLYNHDSDEDVTGCEHLSTIAEQASRAGADCVRLPRRNWLDMGMTRKSETHWPDHQPRLRHWTLRNVWRVHPELEPGAKWIDLNPDGPVCIEHFKHALQSPEAMGETDTYYRELMARDYADGRAAWQGQWMTPDDQ